MPDDLNPLAALGAALGSAALGFVKSKTSLLDGWIGRKIKPIQPALVLGAALGLPYLTNALGLAPVDPSVFITAPSATIAAISFREIYKSAMRRLN